MPKQPAPAELSAHELLALAVGVALAIVPSLPFIESDAASVVRFRNWAIFVGGLLIGAVLATARRRSGR